MPHLEPTYLRYIYDGLVKGSIHPENAAELPDGLIGLYEKAFDERISVVERQKLLQRFAIWALLKKEVSAAFVAEVLGETEDDIQEFISTYSAWFNSPESGKYQLYHERLKVYLLQKLSEGEVHGLYEKLISRLERAIEAQKADEFEWYGLEFLAVHLGVSAIINGDGNKLITLAYSQTHWQRQLRVSKGFNWTKNGLKEVMTWASKYNNDEVIECGLQMVDLHHQEQNSAPQIVALVADGDFDSALKRIEQFGGNDTKGLQRKFILYMLCLMELTLLESKNKPFRKEGIEKLLKHLDEQLPVDHSVLNWKHFFSSYTMFLMACEWAEFGLDYFIVYKRTEDWEKDWIPEKGPYSESQIDVLILCSNYISENSNQCIALKIISAELIKQEEYDKSFMIIQDALEISKKNISNEKEFNTIKDLISQLACMGKIDEALFYARTANECSLVCVLLSVIATELVNKEKIGLAESLMQEVYELIKNIKDEKLKSGVLNQISFELAKQDKIEEAILMMHDAIFYANDNTDDLKKSIAYGNFSEELAKNGKFQEAADFAHKINIDYYKSVSLTNISKEFFRVGKIKESRNKINEALDCIRKSNNEILKVLGISVISTELFEQGKIKDSELLMIEAVELFKSLIDFHKSFAIKTLSKELVKHTKIEKVIDFARDTSALSEVSIEVSKKDNFKISSKLMSLDLEYEGSLIHDYPTFQEIGISLSKQGKSEQSLFCISKITEDSDKAKILSDIASLLINDGKIEEIQNSINSINDEYCKLMAYETFLIELAKHGKFSEAIKIAKTFVNVTEIIGNSFLVTISIEMLKQMNLDNSLEFIRGLQNDKEKSNILREVSAFLFNQGDFKKATTILQEAFDTVNNLKDDSNNSESLSAISVEYARQGDTKNAILLARSIKDEYYKSIALADVSIEFIKKRRIEKADYLMKEALNIASAIKYESDKYNALTEIASKFPQLDKFEEALEILRNIILNSDSSEFGSNFQKVVCSQLDISKKLFSIGEIEKSKSVLMEAIQCALDIKDDFEKDVALIDISKEMSLVNSLFESERNNLEIKLFESQKLDTIQRYFEALAENTIKQIDWLTCIQNLGKIKNNEARKSYMKGFSRFTSIIDCDPELIRKSLIFVLDDVESMENLLKKYALKELFFKNTSNDRIEPLNRTLNLKWAIDLKKELDQLPN